MCKIPPFKVHLSLNTQTMWSVVATGIQRGCTEAEFYIFMICFTAAARWSSEIRSVLPKRWRKVRPTGTQRLITFHLVIPEHVCAFCMVIECLCVFHCNTLPCKENLPVLLAQHQTQHCCSEGLDPCWLKGSVSLAREPMVFKLRIVIIWTLIYSKKLHTLIREMWQKYLRFCNWEKRGNISGVIL